jgi:hypothetical protein
MNEGTFIRILYSPQNILFNGVYLLITLNDIVCDKFNKYNKFKYIFNTVFHKNIIDNLKVIEEDLLKKANIKGKIPQYKIYDQLRMGNIKIFDDIENKTIVHFILKISGIWETQFNYGLTYKFTKINKDVAN